MGCGCSQGCWAVGGYWVECVGLSCAVGRVRVRPAGLGCGLRASGLGLWAAATGRDPWVGLGCGREALMRAYKHGFLYSAPRLLL